MAVYIPPSHRAGGDAVVVFTGSDSFTIEEVSLRDLEQPDGRLLLRVMYGNPYCPDPIMYGQKIWPPSPEVWKGLTALTGGVPGVGIGFGNTAILAIDSDGCLTFTVHLAQSPQPHKARADLSDTAAILARLRQDITRLCPAN
jgi:hypothetical protein